MPSSSGRSRPFVRASYLWPAPPRALDAPRSGSEPGDGAPRGRCRSSARRDGLRISGRPHCGMWIGRRSRRAWSQSPTRPHPTAGHAFYVDKVVITQTMVQTSLDDQLALQHVAASARKDRQLPGPPDRLRPEATCVGLCPVMPSPTAVQPDGRGTMRATDGRRAWSDRWMPSRQTATV